MRALVGTNTHRAAPASLPFSLSVHFQHDQKPEGRNKESSPSAVYGKRPSVANGARDTNGNDVPSASEVRRRFDPKMTVTKLPANDSRYPANTVEQYLSRLKESGAGGYARAGAKDDRPVPVHLPSERNGAHRRDGSPGARSRSNSDFAITKALSEPTSLAKPAADRSGAMSTSLTAKPSERLASIKNQLDPNNPIGKILEKSTVIQVENGDLDYAERKKIRSSPETKLKDLKSDIEKQSKTPKHTTNFASYIQISQPFASGATPKKSGEAIGEKSVKNKEAKKCIKYIDSEEERAVLDTEVESPSGTGFENKTFEHENFLKKRTESNDAEAKDDGVKSMETSTESTISEPTEDSSPETPSARRKILDVKDYDYVKSVSDHFSHFP